MPRIGFMQGRLSPPVDGRIQAFPLQHWQEEFGTAERLGIPLMEWTLDQDGLYENPLMTSAGRALALELGARHRVAVRSVTGDCFMQAPFFKATRGSRAALLEDLRAVARASAAAGARHIVFPLVDNGSIESAAHEANLREGFSEVEPLLRELDLRIVFESDFAPERLARFIEGFPDEVFGVNYDIGNSAALGYDAAEEIASYGTRIKHVHVKDRVLGGTTVPLGEGNADFPTVFGALRRTGYAGDFILQTARAADGRHDDALARYRDLVQAWWGEDLGSRA